MNCEEVIETERLGQVGVIRLADERNRNALSKPMRTGLADAFAAMEADPDVRSVLLTARGKAFCAGGDFRLMRDESDPWSTHQRFRQTSRWLTDLLRYPKPIVVGVNGVAVGGGIGIALVGDVVVAAESASFVSGFSRLGAIPDVGVMYTLPRLVGMAHAREFLLGNQTWSASHAEAVGLIARTVPDEELEAHCLEQAEAMAALPLEGYGLAKWLMWRSFESSLEAMMVHENLGQSVAFSTKAMREGLAAFQERRSPDFVAASECEPAMKVARREFHGIDGV